MHTACTNAATCCVLICQRCYDVPPIVSAAQHAQQFNTAQMVEALDRHPAARRPYRRLFDVTAEIEKWGRVVKFAGLRAE
jgi:hypothetical protein